MYPMKFATSSPRQSKAAQWLPRAPPQAPGPPGPAGPAGPAGSVGAVMSPAVVSPARSWDRESVRYSML